jgi:ADP-ribose pyrophosphatase YjhB (NUDIX family)
MTFLSPAEFDYFRRHMPIACVDILLVSSKREIVLIKRRGEPADGVWWCPGGRILHGETRVEVATRTVREELRVDITHPRELFTADVFLQLGARGISHGVTTVYLGLNASLSQLCVDASIADVWIGKPKSESCPPLPNFVNELLRVAAIQVSDLLSNRL